MRLMETEKLDIAQAAIAALPAGSRVMLLGSRVDDTKRGGDVDLLVEMPAPCPPDEVVRLQSRLAVQLYHRWGGLSASHCAANCGTAAGSARVESSPGRFSTSAQLPCSTMRSSIAMLWVRGVFMKSSGQMPQQFHRVVKDAGN